MKKFESIRQIISFMFVSCAVTILQLVLVNLFLYLMHGWKAFARLLHLANAMYAILWHP